MSLIRFFFRLLVFMYSIQCYSAETLTISQIQSLAVARSPQIRAAAALAKSERHRADGAGILQNPSMNLQMGQVNSGGISGPTYDLTLSQTLPIFGKLASRQRIQELRFQIAETTEAEARLLVQHAATLAAVRLANLTEVSKHSMERRRRFKLIHQYLISHPQVSPSQKIEAALIENQIRILEKGMLELANARESARAELNSFLQFPESPEVEFKWLESTKLPDRATLELKMDQRNPELARKRFETKRQNEVINLAKKEPWPDVSLSFNYRLERVQPQNQFFAGGIAITLPIWDHGQHSIAAAVAAADAEFEAKENLTFRLTRDFKQAWLRVATSEKELQLFPLKLVKTSEKMFDEAEREFRKGRVSTSVLLATDSQIHETLDSIYEVQFKMIESLSQLLMLAGEELHF